MANNLSWQQFSAPVVGVIDLLRQRKSPLIRNAADMLYSFLSLLCTFGFCTIAIRCTAPTPTYFWRTLKMHSIESGKYQFWSALLACLNLHWRVQGMISSYKAKFETMNPMQCIISIVLKCREWFAIQTLHPWGVCFSEYLQSLILQIPSVAKVLCWGDCFAI